MLADCSRAYLFFYSGAALLGAHVPALTRYAIAPPVFLSLGYLSSAREGL